MKNNLIPKISIVVPIYNVEEYLDRCIDSLINQTLKEIEIILVDDESPDSCPKKCDEYAKKDSRIKVIHKKNEGLGYARNSGLNIATGEYVAFVDSDDYVDLDFYEKVYVSAKENNTDVTFADMKSFDSNMNVKNINKINLGKKIFVNEEIKYDFFYNMLGIKEEKNIGISACRAIYKKSNFDKYNIRFVSERKLISEDYIFHLDYIPICKKISVVNDTYYNYCDNKGESLTRSYRKDRFKAAKILFLEIENRVKKLNCYDDLKNAITKSFVVNVRVSIKQEKFNNKKDAIYNIKTICEDELTQTCINSGYEQTIKQKIFDTLIKLKISRILYFIINKV